MVTQMNGSDYFSISDFGGYFAERQYTAGCPILKDGNLLGYAYVSMPAGNMSAYIADNFQIFILSALGVLTLTFIVLYAMTYRMGPPGCGRWRPQHAASAQAISATASRSRVGTRLPSSPLRSTIWRFRSPRWRDAAFVCR